MGRGDQHRAPGRVRGDPAAGRSGHSVARHFFLHQSTGQGIMEDHGGHPGLVSQLQTLGHNFGDYNLWDSPPGGSVPTEIAALFADSNHDGHFGDALESVAALHGARDADILMLKSCFYTLAELEDPANLALWQQAFIDNVAPYANQHPDQTLVVMPAVPLRAEAGLSAAAAARARDWAQWLVGDFITLYATQGNVSSFDLFDFWADAEDHPTNANALQRQYCRTDGDDHPNDAAYSAAADALTEFLTRSLGGDSWQNPDQPYDVSDDGARHGPRSVDGDQLHQHPSRKSRVTRSARVPAAVLRRQRRRLVYRPGCAGGDQLHQCRQRGHGRRRAVRVRASRPAARAIRQLAAGQGPSPDAWPQHPISSPLLWRSPNGRPTEWIRPPALPTGAATKSGGASALEGRPFGRNIGPRESARETGLPELEPILMEIAEDIRDAGAAEPCGHASEGV